MKTLHTPGPWAIVERNAPRGALMIESQHGLIAVMESSKTRPVTYEKAEFNARLIAAAPDLLEALQDMVAGDAEAIEEAEAFGVPFPESMLATYKKARAAIAKATGESQ